MQQHNHKENITALPGGDECQLIRCGTLLNRVAVLCFRNYLNYVVEELKDPYRYHVSLLLTVILCPL